MGPDNEGVITPALLGAGVVPKSSNAEGSS